MALTGQRRILQIHPTRRCNLQCLHCYSRSGPQIHESLDADVLLRTIEEAASLGYDVLGVSGGEPLLYRPLATLLRAAHKLGMRTTVTTNGMLLDERRVDELTGLIDVLAISLDGTPKTHAQMRQNERAFTSLERRLPHLRASGIPFGFITTLTQHNVHELAWVATFAQREGAVLLQVHPLEPEGYAADCLKDAVPDVVELACAFLESLRLRSQLDLVVQLDVVRRSDLERFPEQFLVPDNFRTSTLGEWLTPLVIETNGSVVPLAYGMPRRFGLGSIVYTPLTTMAIGWSPEPLRRLCRSVHERLTAEAAPEFVNWYDALVRAARGVHLAPTS